MIALNRNTALKCIVGVIGQWEPSISKESSAQVFIDQLGLIYNKDA